MVTCRHPTEDLFAWDNNFSAKGHSVLVAYLPGLAGVTYPLGQNSIPRVKKSPKPPSNLPQSHGNGTVTLGASMSPSLLYLHVLPNPSSFTAPAASSFLHNSSLS